MYIYSLFEWYILLLQCFSLLIRLTLIIFLSVVGLLEGCKLLTNLLQGTKQYNVIGKLGTATDTFNDLGADTQSALYRMF